MKNIFVLIFFILNSFLNIVNSQVITEWTSTYPGPFSIPGDYGNMAVDSFGNVYVGGYNNTSGTNDDYVLIKYNSLGVQQGVAK